MTDGLQLSQDESNEGIERLAIVLGLFSIGLGVAEVVALRRVPRRTSLHPAVSAAGLLGVTALGVYVAKRLGEHAGAPAMRTLRVHDVATINAPIGDVYQFWRRFSFAQHMRHVDSVQVVDDRHSHWQVRVPAGATLEWDAIITEDVPDSRLEWRSEPDAPIVHAGTVTFTSAAGGRGTELRVSLTYEPPGGRLGAVAAWMGNGLVGSQIREDLRRCKQVIETGEVLLSDGPALWRAAQPAGDVVTARTAAGVGR